MALYPGVAHKLFGGHDGPMSAHLGIVLHVNDSDGNLDNWVRNQGNNMSSHFEVYKSGAGSQYVDTAFASWCQEAGNDTYLSIETEGLGGEGFTAAQFEKVARIIAWASHVHHIPLHLAEHPGDRGLGWHGMGGAAWGGHPNCPGNKRKAARSALLARAAAIPNPQPAPKPAPKPKPVPQPVLYAEGSGAAKYLSSADRSYALVMGSHGKLQVHRNGVIERFI